MSSERRGPLRTRRSERAIAEHADGLGFDVVRVQMHRNELAGLRTSRLVFRAGGTPQLDAVGTVPVALSVDRKQDVLLAVVLDDAVAPDAGVAVDDELLHVPGLAQSPYLVLRRAVCDGGDRGDASRAAP